MSFSVNTNAGALAALQNLNATSRGLDVTQSRVNTGLKVSSAKDDAATYAIAQTLRSEVAGYNAVNSSIDRARSELDVAIAGAEAISDLLIQMKEKAVAAKDDGLDSASRSSLNNDYQQLVSQIDSIANNAVFNGKNLLTGDSSTAITSADGSTSITSSFTSLDTTTLGLSGSSLSGSGGTNTALPATTVFISGDRLSALNNYMSDNFSTIYNDAGRYNQGNGQFSDVNDAITVISTGLGPLFDVNSVSWSAPPNGSEFMIEASSTGVYIEGTGASATLTTSASSGSADQAVDSVETAIDTVNDVLSDLGATANRLETQQVFTSQLSDSLDVGIGNLVDADLAKESAALQSFQTKQQLGLQALSIANQAPQTVLSLFR